jgi:dTDP-glucose 4,6-dehydratase
MNTIIVTGGLGFIGSNLIKLLNKKNYYIINIDKVNYSSNHQNIPDNIQNYKFYKEDINNRTAIKNIINKYNPKVIYNLAAETHVDRSIDDPKNFINSNILGIYNLLEVVRNLKKKIKFIQVSTDEVYGDINNKKSSKESDPYNPSSPYAASKASGDLLIKSYIRTYKIPSIITNCCNNYGPNQYPEKLIPTIIYNLILKKSIPIYGSGKNIREWIYVEDHCNALIKIGQKGLMGENYNIGSGKTFNNIEIANIIIKIFSEMKNKYQYNGKIKFVKDRPGHDLKYSLNSDKIKKELNWKCETNFNNGIKKTIKWYLNKFENNFFRNKKFTKRLGIKI